jgi:hypothetical protein
MIPVKSNALHEVQRLSGRFVEVVFNINVVAAVKLY